MKRHSSVLQHRKKWCAALALSLFSYLLWWLALELNEPLDIDLRSEASIAVYDRDEQLLRLSLSSDEHYRLPVNLDNFSQDLIEATILYEDKNYYSHGGVDWPALARAAVRTYLLNQKRQGGSTITMQLARMRYNIHSRSIPGKLEQILYALRIEHHYDKRSILEAYFSLLPYGGNIQGTEAASLLYFNKRAAELSQQEAYALALIPQSPAKRNPSTATGRARLSRATRALLKRSGKSADLNLHFRTVAAARSNIAPHFSDAVILEERRSQGSARHHIATTLSASIQQKVNQILTEYVSRSGHLAIENAAALFVDTRNNHILAEVGSASYYSESIQGQVNGTRAKRSPGSTIKPFIYALAIDDGLIHPESLLADAPRRYSNFNPENYDRDFRGPMTATHALVQSRNIPAVDLLNQIGLPRLRTLLVSSGITDLHPVEHYGLTLALGGAEITMHELVRLYSSLARSGMASALIARKEKTPKDMPTSLISPGAAYLTKEMLSRHIRPGQFFQDTWTNSATPVSWKTGTSHGFRDAWTVGIAGHYVLAVWIGRFDGRGDPSFTGRTAAAPLFFEILDALKGDSPGLRQQDDPPNSVTEVNACPISGKLPGPHCPHQKAIPFLAGVSPIKKCDIHRSIIVRKDSGLRVCPDLRAPDDTEERIVEQWPSDIADLFRQAGFSKENVPPFESDCMALDLNADGHAPQILAPVTGTQIVVTPIGKNHGPLVLKAITGTDSEYHDWFADLTYIGRSERGTSMLWEPKIGEFEVRVVDDRGRTDHVQITVTAF